MKRVIFPAVFVVLLLVMLVGASMAEETPTPSVVTSPLPSGGDNTIYGEVYDANGSGIPNAKVTLYYAAYVGYKYEPRGLVRLDGVTNPQYTGDGASPSTPVGVFVFTNIPEGTYVLIAEKDNFSVQDDVTVSSVMTGKDLIIHAYIGNDITPTPTPTKTPTPTIKPTPTVKTPTPTVKTPTPTVKVPTPTIRPTTAPDSAQEPGLGDVLVDVLRVVLMSVISVQLLVGVIIIAILASGRKH